MVRKNFKNICEKKVGARAISGYGEGETQFCRCIFDVFTAKQVIFLMDGMEHLTHQKNDSILRFILR